MALPAFRGQRDGALVQRATRDRADFLREALLASTALVASALLPDTIHAQDATWLNTPVLPFFNDFANWDTGVVPTGTAFFGQSSSTFLFMTAPSTSIGGWTFNSGASDYTFVSNQSLIFTGPGIVINGGSATIANTGTLEFFGTSTAGSATINNNGYPEFFQHQHGRQRPHQCQLAAH